MKKEHGRSLVGIFFTQNLGFRYHGCLVSDQEYSNQVAEVVAVMKTRNPKE